MEKEICKFLAILILHKSIVKWLAEAEEDLLKNQGVNATIDFTIN